MTSQTGKQMVTVNIMPIILGSKGNPAMKFGYLILFKKHFSSEVMQKIRQGT